MTSFTRSRVKDYRKVAYLLNAANPLYTAYYKWLYGTPTSMLLGYRVIKAN